MGQKGQHPEKGLWEGLIKDMPNKGHHHHHHHHHQHHAHLQITPSSDKIGASDGASGSHKWL